MCMCEAHYGESLLWLHKSNVFVNLFVTLALMTFVHSPFMNTYFRKTLWRLQSWAKEFLTAECS